MIHNAGSTLGEDTPAASAIRFSGFSSGGNLFAAACTWQTYLKTKFHKILSANGNK